MPTQDSGAGSPVIEGFLPQVTPIPADGLLLHVGVHKTGTTAMQAALADARPQLREHGVSYPGKRAAHHRAALAMLQRPWGWADRGGEVFDRQAFDSVAQRAADFNGRVVVSSEFFCESGPELAAEVAQGLGGPRVHVLITLRSLGNLLPSSWQQYLKYGTALGYEKWLESVLSSPGGSSVTPSFWRRNDHARVVDNWAKAVGAPQVTVLVLEGLDRRAMYRTFSQLIDIPAQILESRMNLTSNRSFTAYEAHLLLELNRRIAKTMDWQDYTRLIRRGMALQLVEDRTPPATEAKLHTPDWALSQAAELGRQAAGSIRDSGVQVLGDIEALGMVAPTGPYISDEDLANVPMDVAVSSLQALVAAAVKPADDETVSTRDLAAELWSRVRKDARARVTNRSLRKP